MARPREFDMETALSGAMDIFWRRGFLGTNLPDLLAAMRLTRGSFYKAFRDKETAYLQALETYDAQVVGKTVVMLDTCGEGSAAACLLPLFAGKDPTRGCLICNAMVELGPMHPTVAQKANEMAARLREAIARVIRRYPTAVPDQDVDAMADTILHLYFGHQALGKSQAHSDDWADRLARMLGENPA